MIREHVATIAAVAAVLVAFLAWVMPFRAVAPSPVAYLKQGLQAPNNAQLQTILPPNPQPPVSSVTGRGQQAGRPQRTGTAANVTSSSPTDEPTQTGAPQDGVATAVTPRGEVTPGSQDANLEERAVAGDTSAQVQLAEMYYKGWGVARDYGRALFWYEKAASQKSVAAEVQLGWMYSRGIGTNIDRTAAAHWFYEAALAGSARAQNYLGYAYLQGWGVPLDYSEANRWLAASAAQNDYLGLYNYGFLKEHGRGGPPDLPLAIDLYKRSAAQGYQGAREALRRLRIEP